VINVRALITFLASHEGGRTSDVRSTYRPLHNFGEPNNREMWFGEIRLDENDKISPGESREVWLGSTRSQPCSPNYNLGALGEFKKGHS
jgi:hypothetical protein